jgi:hypothetical protein
VCLGRYTKIKSYAERNQAKIGIGEDKICCGTKEGRKDNFTKMKRRICRQEQMLA